MKNQITNITNKLFAVIAITMILTAAVFAQMPNAETKNREQAAEALHQQMKVDMGVERREASKVSIMKKGATVAVMSNQENFNLGKEFVMAMFDAEGIEDYEDAADYTILDLVYLIDRLEGQPEAVQLQKTLKSVVRGTGTAIQIRKEIELVSKAYLNRQKVDQKWYVNAGSTTMNLSISTYFGEDAAIKKGLAGLQALIKTAPKGTAREVLEPMSLLAKFVTKTAFTEEDYVAIFEGIGEVIDAVSA